MTTRIAVGIVTAFSIVAVSARADTIYVRGAEKPLEGTIKSEDAKTVVVTPLKAKKDVTIPSTEILDIATEKGVFGTLGLPGGPFLEGQKAEKDAEAADAAARKKLLSLAIVKYEETVKKMGQDTKGQKNAARNLEYKIALLTLKQADDASGTDKAIGKLEAFRKDHGNSWQIHHVMPMIAQIQMDNGKFTDAAETFKAMAAMEVLTPEVKSDAELRVVEVMVRAKKIEEANKMLDTLEKKFGKNPSMAARVKLARAEVLVGLNDFAKAVPLLQDIVKNSTDKQTKALSHNSLGECLFKQQKYQEALWEFLWVDAVYNQDKSQHAKALFYLWKTFEQLNDAERARQCRESLSDDRSFAGTDWQRQAQK